ncbi:BZ3500_MvSof-1268-A1-R1_Chr9g10795 [Microbotryum saponariae]|uniref:BZ3500_MvSof-1268-A1-R1_Chr9g10795 protein n=1 Tax=Microbotryum saponariae TaxID=289078 RepID=A0A2X0N671_9BASI|nr:BZ3501_MvSof-1269-A2-R1_Chr9g10543 [Microbotryum saponariae]SDA00706.1 BZ3500_MvSof-1268-A1-R1_Chr9g10795 [Microbotryum saponariae]
MEADGMAKERKRGDTIKSKKSVEVDGADSKLETEQEKRAIRPVCAGHEQEDMKPFGRKRKRQTRTERHKITLEPHWFRVQTERIKRCDSQAKKDYLKD